MDNKSREQKLEEFLGQDPPDISDKRSIEERERDIARERDQARASRPTAPEPETDPFEPLTEPQPGNQRWQYAYVIMRGGPHAGNTAMALAVAGAHGWELVAVQDDARLIFKRAVMRGQVPESWCVPILV